MKMERVQTSDLTDALIRASERAGEFKHVVIIFDGDGKHMACFSNDNLTVEHMNIMLDRTKAWLLGLLEED